MKIDNPLSEAFLQRYPSESARVLEKIPAEHVAAFLSAIPAEVITPVVVSMLPGSVAACLNHMENSASVKFLSAMPACTVARIYRLLSKTRQQELSSSFSEKYHRQLISYLQYPADSVGALLHSGIDILPQSITVDDALHRLEDIDHAVGCDIFIINDEHQLVGVIQLGKLLTAKHHLRVRDIMSTRTNAISAHALIESVAEHPAWNSRLKLPVIERDKTLLGIVQYSRLQQVLGESSSTVQRDPLDAALSLVSLYWISLAQLLSSLMGISQTEKGDQ